MSTQGTLAGFFKPVPSGPRSEEEQGRVDAARKLKELEEAREGAVARGNAWPRTRFGLDQSAPVGPPPPNTQPRVERAAASSQRRLAKLYRPRRAATAAAAVEASRRSILTRSSSSR